MASRPTPHPVAPRPPHSRCSARYHPGVDTHLYGLRKTYLTVHPLRSPVLPKEPELLNHTAWMSMRSAMRSQDDLRPFSKKTMKRIGGFARPHAGKLIVFLILSTITAALTVATPILAGRVVDAITESAATGVVVRLAVL